MIVTSYRSVLVFLLLEFVLVNSQGTNLPISLKGRYTCTLHPSNQLWLEVRTWDENGHATRLNAINAQEEEITACTVSGSGTMTSPFYMSSKVQMTNDQEVSPGCGMTSTTLNGNVVYNWRVKAYTYPIDYFPNNRGYILTIQCDTGDLADGRVETIIGISVPSFVVNAANPADVTGPNSIATGASIIYSANIYPNGRLVSDELLNAKGFYMHTCYSADNVAMTGGQLFIDGNGCPVSGATYAPTSPFTLATDTGDYIEIQASFAEAVFSDSQKTVYLQCRVGTCPTLNDPHCINYCETKTAGIYPDNTIKTNVTFSTSFIVENRQAHELRPTPIGSISDILTTVKVGEAFTIASLDSPSGIGSSNLQDAKGFYVSNCRYATNAQMTNPTQFIDQDGCLIRNTKFTPASDFESYTTSQYSNTYVTRSGSIVIQDSGNTRYWVKCSSGKCTVEGHNYCIRRCGATNNFIGGAVDLGDVGHSFTLSVLDVLNVPAVRIQVQTPNGQTITSPNDSVYVGDNLNFGLTVTPEGSGTGSSSFANAKGIYIEDCYATIDGQESQFIDANGCPVPNSPYQTSGNCVDVTQVDGVPPFELQCGTMTVPQKGEVSVRCKVKTCTTVNNPICDNRCAVGDILPNSNVLDPGITSTSAFTAQVRGNTRTAVKSEELRTIIAAICAVGAGLFLLVISLGTCFIVSKQKGLAKRRIDNRRYNY